MINYNWFTMQDIIKYNIKWLLLESQKICNDCCEKNLCNGCQLNYMIKDLIKFLERF